MGRPWELVNRHSVFDLPSAVTQQAEVTGQGRRSTGNHHHHPGTASAIGGPCQFGGLTGRSGAGRIEHHRCIRSQFGRSQRATGKIAGLGGHGQTAGPGGGGQCAERGCLALDRMDRAALALSDRQSETAAAGIKIGQLAPASIKGGEDGGGNSGLTLAAGLEKGPGRRFDRDRAEANQSGTTPGDRFGPTTTGKAPMESGEIGGFRKAGQSLAAEQIEPGFAFDQQVETAFRGGDGDIAAPFRDQFGQQLPQRCQHGRQGRGQQRTGFQIDQSVTGPGIEADSGGSPPRAPGEHRPPALAGREADQGGTGDIAQSGPGQGLGEDLTFPDGLRGRLQMLQGTATAPAEMRTGRVGPARSGGDHFDQRGHQPIAPAGLDPGQDPVTGSGEGDEHGLSVETGESIALAAEPVDFEGDSAGRGRTRSRTGRTGGRAHGESRPMGEGTAAEFRSAFSLVARARISPPARKKRRCLAFRFGDAGLGKGGHKKPRNPLPTWGLFVLY